jgi:hypothetical protein
MIFMDLIFSAIVCFFSYAVIKFKELRSAMAEAIQNGDKIFHWLDAKRFSCFVAGCIMFVFTINVIGVFLFASLEIAWSSLVFIGMLFGVTFTLWGVAWKNPIDKKMIL